MRDYYGHIGSPVTFDEAGVRDPYIGRLTDLAARGFAQRGMSGYTPTLIETIYRRAAGNPA